MSNCQAGQIDIGRFSLDNVEAITMSIGQSDAPVAPKAPVQGGMESFGQAVPFDEEIPF